MSATESKKFAHEHINSVKSATVTIAAGGQSTGARSDSLAELKNGKVIFKQKPLSLDKQSETLQEIVSFRDMLEQRIENEESPLLIFPSEFKPLIAKLAHESDKTLAALTKHIHHELMPMQDDEEQEDGNSPAATMLPYSLVETAIKDAVTRNNYGLDVVDGAKAPAATSVWRWEVAVENYNWLPKNVRLKAETRLAERIQAKQELANLFRGLSLEEREAILPKGTAKHPAHNKQPHKKDVVNLTGDEAKSNTPKKSRASKINDDISTPDTSVTKALRLKNPVDPEKEAEKTAKEKERLEKKATKAEKESKAKDALDKSRSIMANFFTRPKVTFHKTRVPAPGPSVAQSGFERTFKPFVLKRDAELASTNWFQTSRCRKWRGEGNVIIIDDHDAEMEEVKKDLSHMTEFERLKDILASMPPPLDRSRLPDPHQKPPSYKTYHPVSIRSLVTRLSEAEVSGDISLVRSILSQLSNRRLFPAKVLLFREDARPGYFGTWTRSSKFIGPRTPLAKDTLEFDYGYDSGEEWEEESGEADDVLEDEEEDVDEDADSDLDSWLVDDDEEIEMNIADTGSPPPEADILFPQPTKRKSNDTEKTVGKRRKLIIPLVAFAKGPCWESTIGRSDYEPLNQYKIQLFNDTPFGANPFTYTSTCMEDYRISKKPTVPVADIPFAIPPLPDRVAEAATTLSAKAPLKTPFPDAHLQLLLSRITSLQSPNINFLVDAIHHELRAHKVKKNAIEAKVREVGERCKEKKVWVIKPEVTKLALQL